jgi:thiamine-monophosphate kinase
VQDLGHICRASRLSATIEAWAVPLSAAAAAAGPAWREMILTGGDDYELLLAVPPDEVTALREMAEAADVPVSCIGKFTAGPPVVTVRDETGQTLSFAKGGWSHLSG